MKFTSILKMAFFSILSNKVRSLLTMLGIIIGISSVIVLVGMGEGTKQKVASQIEKLGTNLITVNITGNRNKAVSTSELEELRQKPGIKDIAPTLTQNNINIKGGDKTATTNMEASTPNYFEIRKLDIASGRTIQQNDLDNRFKVAVIGITVADELFGSTNVVGETMSINGYDFTIIGVLTTQGGSGGNSGDDRVIIPLTTAQRLVKSTDIRSFYIEASDKDSVDEAMGYLQLFLNNKYNNDTKSYRIFNQTSLLETSNQTNDSMTTMLSGIAGISLVVGGIGIMNIMLVSVIERTKEIGIRKAIGAKRENILMQFLIEAGSISGIGGILGVLFGYAFAYVGNNYFKMSVVISNNVVLVAFLFSLAVGVIFGMYPANKASKLNPIEALRFE
ncbi:ABC transporter permease [Clostridiaceae bacterium UIB06]|uniref:ABC transporter permease n=1 Tax=Clostridium thailandense TaxID=2794346 RepID=A0A949TPA7_9CLOT|nr:ABC transporter permease [Clostridium thailandense]MBV7274097.1 ABC transporter permease [Clostridium thailandense]MCH5137679.1 ABC transporter permease [Clostridiaceae bacterium UIB06]